MIKKIAVIHHLNLIISDNRYGLYCCNVHSVIVTHQISPVLPFMFRWAEYPLSRIIRMAIQRFDECWIPDCADQKVNLTGKLSHRYKMPGNGSYIGILSRFMLKKPGNELTEPGAYDLVIVASGPEPQLSIFNKMIINQTLHIPCRTMLVTGLSQDHIPSELQNHASFTIVHHLDKQQFQYTLLNAGIIVCRAGYSSIMDLIALGKTAILVPTPGQPEQEYLAEYLSQKGWFTHIRQHELDLKTIIMHQHNLSTPDFKPLLDFHKEPSINQGLYEKGQKHRYKSNKKSSINL